MQIKYEYNCTHIAKVIASFQMFLNLHLKIVSTLIPNNYYKSFSPYWVNTHETKALLTLATDIPRWNERHLGYVTVAILINHKQKKKITSSSQINVKWKFTRFLESA